MPILSTFAHSDLPSAFSWQAIAYAALIRVTVFHAGTDYAIDGVGNVLTATPYRGQGYGRQVVERVNDRLDTSDADAAALFCAPDLEPFYAAAGWSPCPGGTRVDSHLYSELRMMRMLSPRARAAAKSLLTTTMDVGWAW
ncbi:GNAT family N-acetyltransferase [Actinoplanes sp. NPDC051861]|uniref:GNAT family N-acetyltransferase n=1 Tax=Actinoplanes sp. NPDC051861 TaxID=3155170 RepID=UPI0034444656